MVPEEFRQINRAICLLEDKHQDERETARTALHKIFRYHKKLQYMLMQDTVPEETLQREWEEI